MQVTIDFDLTDTDFADLVDLAGHAISDWADEASYEEPYHETDPRPAYSICCEEGTQIYELHKEDFERAIALIAQNRVDVSSSIRHDVMAAIREDDYGCIDGYAIDAIVQVACFGEIVYA
jgi:hypothetical protein